MRWYFGIYLVFHGLIHQSLTEENLEEKTQVYSGSSGHSWLLERFMDYETTQALGKMIWMSLVFLFIIAGLGILALPWVNLLPEFIILLASFLSIAAYFLFFNGLDPTPYHWLLAPLIDITLILYILVFSSSSYEIMIILGIYALAGFLLVFVTDILPGMFKDRQKVDGI